jgi:Ca2+-binding RTX toxin-like protein
MSVSLTPRRGRRGAKLAAVFAGTLLTYLVVAAVPAQAASACSTAGGIGYIDVGTDDDVVAVISGNYWINVNLTLWIDCGFAPGAVGDLVVTGSDAGNETFTFLYPADFTGENNIVDLGNGNDGLFLEYGGIPALFMGDPGTNDFLNIGSAEDGTLVGDMNYGGLADLRVDDAETVTINGGDGDDFLDAGNFGTITGFAGVIPANDIPDANDPYQGDLTLNGGNGDDGLVSGDGNDNFQGGPGTDYVDYYASGNGVVVDLAAATGTGMGNDTLADVQDVLGSEWDDTITGNGLDNWLRGGEGDDVVSGAGGSDFVVGGPDNDTVAGGTGDDSGLHVPTGLLKGVYGGPGDDVIVEDAAENGTDFLSGAPPTDPFGFWGYDVLDYSARTNPLYVEHLGGAISGEGGCPTAVTCEDDDVTSSFSEFWLGAGADEFVGVGGVDEWIVPGTGDDMIDSGFGDNDVLDLSASATGATFDLINGTATSDQGTETFDGIESAVGTDADDSMIIDENSPFVDFFGGDGVDTVDGSQALDDLPTIDLALLGSGKDVENAIGGAGDDDIYGNEMANMLWGGDGNDFIDGRFGNDWIEGGAGNDALTGNLGADTLSYADAPNGVVIDNQLGFAAGHGDDAIDFFEIIFGSAYDDEIIAGQTQFSANQRIVAGTGDDIIVGSNSSDLLKGGGGNDNIRGGQGDDDLMGAGGDDYLSGSQGDDYLKGGKGTDTGNGGKGADVCKGVEFPKSC